MPRLPRWDAAEAERSLLRAGFDLIHTNGSHRIYGKGGLRVTVPFHGAATLHPQIIRQVLEIIEEAARESAG